MKTNLNTVLLILLFPICAFSQSARFTLTGNLNIKHNGKQITLHRPAPGFMQPDSLLGSSTVINGKLIISGNVMKPLFAKLKFENSKDQTEIFIIPGDTVVFAATDSLKHSTFPGNTMMNDYIRFKHAMKDVYQSLDRFTSVVNGVKADPNKPVRSNQDLVDWAKLRNDTVKSFAAKNPDSYMALYLFDSFVIPFERYEELMPIYDKFTTRVKNTSFGKAVLDRLSSMKFLGTKFRDFTSSTPDGQQINLTEIVKQSKYTLLDFWASWCQPCRKENPTLIKAYNQFHNKGLNILSVSLDAKKVNWVEAIAKDGMPWYNVANLKGFQDPLSKLYNVETLPRNFLINSNGVIVAHDLGGEGLIQKIAELFK